MYPSVSNTYSQAFASGQQQPKCVEGEHAFFYFLDTTGIYLYTTNSDRVRCIFGEASIIYELFNVVVKRIRLSQFAISDGPSRERFMGRLVGLEPTTS